MQPSKLNIMSINFNSIISPERRLAFFNILKNHKPHICFLSETRLSARHKPTFDGFNIIRNDSGRGTAIILKQSYKFNIVPFQSDIFSVCLATITSRNPTGLTSKILIGSIYIPSNAGQRLSAELDRFHALINTFDAALIGGDFNARHSSWGDNVHNRNGNLIYNWFYNGPFLNLDLIAPNSPTFPRSSSVLDFFIISSSLNSASNVANSSTCSTFSTPSDHFGILLKLNIINFFPLMQPPVTYTSFENTDWEAFRTGLHNGLSLLNVPTERNISNLEIDTLISEINERISSCVETNSCVRDAKNSKYNHISDFTKKLFRLRNIWLTQLKRLYHRHLNRINDEYRQLHSRIQCLSKIIRERVKIDTNNAFRSRLKKIKPSPQAFKEIDRITGRKFFGTDISKGVLIHNGQELVDIYDKLNACRGFYSLLYSETEPVLNYNDETEISSTVNQFCDTQLNRTLTSFTPSNLATNPNLAPFTTPNAVNMLRISLSNKKSSGIDQISNFILRKCPHSLDVVLSSLFNHCINNAYFPTIWKRAKILPIAKKKSAKELTDFRPISLLSNIGKLFERVIAEQLNNFCEESNVIPNNQFGFKRGHSTEHASLVLHNKIVQNLRYKRCTVSLDIDLEKAFDSVWHKGLLYKLIRLNCPTWLTRIIRSFLENRCSSIFIGSESSDYFPIYSGVVQGSILGPTLFNIFIHDFPFQYPMLEEPGAILYADDTIILASDTRPINALNKIKGKLPILVKYFDKWGLKINTAKCGITCFRNASGRGHYLAVKESKSLTLEINGNHIPLRDEMKYLGIHFHNRLLFNKHARKVLTKAKMVTVILKPLLQSKYMSANTKLLMYKTLIRPIIIYGFCTWFTISPIAAKELQSFERKILRFCCGKFRKPDKKWFSNKTLYEETKITPLMIYQTDLLLKRLERIGYHPNLLIKSLLDSNINDGVEGHYYLSPFNLLNPTSLSVLRPDARRSLFVPFYEKASPLNLRG